MANFDEAYEFVKREEGGLVDHPNDPGGLTNRGVSWPLFKGIAKSLLNIEPTRINLIRLTEEQAKFIFCKQFWEPMKGDLINSQKVADCLFDGYVNMGVNAIKIAQKILDVEQDGDIGRITLLTLNGFREEAFLEKFLIARADYYINLANKTTWAKKFIKGWLNRVNRLKNYVNLKK